MSNPPRIEFTLADRADIPRAYWSLPVSWPLRYGLSLLFVAVATALAFLAQHLIAAANLTLIYVIPVVVAATLFGWGPSLLAVFVGVVAFDFFFTVPYYSLAMNDPSEIWAVVLLLIVAIIVTSVSAESRRRALVVSEAAERAEALHALAHTVLESREPQDVLKSAADALHRIFHAPSVVFTERDGEMEISASAGGAQITQADREAALGAAALKFHTRGESYPYIETYFDFWPVSTADERNCVLGVDFAHSSRERPASVEIHVEAIAGYVSAALGSRYVRPIAEQR